MVVSFFERYGMDILLGIAYIVAFVGVWCRSKANVKKATAQTQEETNAAAEKMATAVDMVKRCINQFIKDAEQMKNYTGPEKKNFVITRTLQIAMGIMTEQEIGDYIESQISLTRAVNNK